MTSIRPRILFVENSADVARAVAAMLERHRFEIARANDPAEAVNRIGAEHFDVVIVEVKLSADDGGFRFLHHVKASVPHLTTRIVAISNDPSPAVLRELEAIGVCDIILKPVHETEILNAISECIDSTPSSVQ